MATVPYIKLPVQVEKNLPKRRTLFIVGGILIALGLVIASFFVFPGSFNLVLEAYRTVEDWAMSRGRQVRLAFRLRLDRLRPEGNIGTEGITTNTWNSLKIQTLSPPVQSQFRNFTAAAQAIARNYGKELIIWDAARSLERQLALYKRGRTESGTTVTWTIASRHLFGLAADYIVRNPNDGILDFSGHPAWYTREVLPLAATFGLSSLYLRRGIDKAHIEVPEESLPPSVKQAVAQLKSDFPGVV